MILFYRRGGLGDTLLTFPVLEVLKKMGERIFAVGNTDYLKIAKEVGWIDEMHYEIPERSFSKVIKVSVDGNVKPFPEKRVWIVDHYLESLGLKKIYSDKLNLKPILNNPFKGRAVIHPSSGSRAKNPPIELFLRIEEYLKRQGYQVIYFVGEADEWVKGFASEFYQSTDPLEIGRALKEAKLFVGNDSGISHLASYVGVPTFVFYGPTDPIVWRPIGRRVFQISLNPDCSPCFPNTCQERPCLDVEELFKRFVGAFRVIF